MKLCVIAVWAKQRQSQKINGTPHGGLLFTFVDSIGCLFEFSLASNLCVCVCVCVGVGVWVWGSVRGCGGGDEGPGSWSSGRCLWLPGNRCHGKGRSSRGCHGRS